MAWTYSGNPRASAKDAVRFELQDTDPSAHLLTDEEVEFAIIEEIGENTAVSELTQAGICAATARLAEILARKFLAQADTTEGSVKTTYTKQAAQYDKMADDLRKRASGIHAPVIGSNSPSEKAARAANESEVHPLFKRKQFDIPYKGPSTPPFPNPTGEEQAG